MTPAANPAVHDLDSGRLSFVRADVVPLSEHRLSIRAGETRDHLTADNHVEAGFTDPRAAADRGRDVPAGNDEGWAGEFAGLVVGFLSITGRAPKVLRRDESVAGDVHVT